MSRIRSIHPGFWNNYKTIQTSAYGRLLFLGLGNLADDSGIFEWHPKALKLQILPNDRVNITLLLRELLDKKWIETYYVEGVQYGKILNFRRWQLPKSPVYKYPDERGYFPPEGFATKLKPHKAPSNAPQAPSCSEKTSTMNGLAKNLLLGEERSGIGCTDSSPASLKIYLPKDWMPSESDRLYALTLGLSFPELFEDFCQHWRQKEQEQDPKGQKSDWSLTWKRWCRRSKIWQQHTQPPPLRGKRDVIPAKSKTSNLSWMVDQFTLGKEQNNG